jgi:hypothetical protein
MAQLQKQQITPKKFYEFGYSGLYYKDKLTLLFSASVCRFLLPAPLPGGSTH